MAEDGGRSAGENGRHPVSTDAENSVPNGVHAAVLRVERPSPHPPGDPAVAEAPLAKLRARHNPPLPAGEGRNRLIHRA